ncbi:MAG TPA: Asp-tRNA(Asn)/Glu-tRNA(Gln) amidotransferase subunit GatC [Vicinamibacterales bacterium]|nr:Asp-tRNA(Asn)/Glu-tRNA(Gln) amidotransferase subunit GatC [Vicinamibacterales bacterium]
MASSLTAADVERIAALAHLELDEAEKALYTKQLAGILAYAAEIQQIDTTGVPPTSHVLPQQSTERDDEVRPSLAREESLGNAPDASVDDGLFKVPRVIG